MSELEADLRRLVRNVVDADVGRDPAHLWAGLCEAGVTDVAVARPDDAESGDLWDLAACVEELAAAGRSTPLVERAVAQWTGGRDLDVACTATVATGLTERSGDTISGSVMARWGTDSDVLVILRSEDAPVMVDPRGVGVQLGSGADVADEPVARVTLEDAPCRVISDVSPAAVTARLRVLRAAALAGVSRAMYEQTRNFVRQREQFGGPLLRIPAVASNLAVMRTWLVQSSAAFRRAAHVTRCGSVQEADTAALVARLLASEGSTEVARIAHQLHGAIGVTAEFGLQHLSKRAWAWRDADWSERDLAVELGRRSVDASEAAYWESVTA